MRSGWAGGFLRKGKTSKIDILSLPYYSLGNLSVSEVKFSNHFFVSTVSVSFAFQWLPRSKTARGLSIDIEC